MDLPPINDKRCDNKLCQYASVCNVLALLLTLILITGFAQADITLSKITVDFKADDSHHQDLKKLSLVITPKKLIVSGNSQIGYSGGHK